MNLCLIKGFLTSIYYDNIAVNLLENEEVCQNVYEDKMTATGCNITCKLDARNASNDREIELFCGGT